MTYEQLYAGARIFMFFMGLYVVWFFLATGELMLPNNKFGSKVRFAFKWYSRLMVIVNVIILIFILGLLWETRSY